MPSHASGTSDDPFQLLEWDWPAYVKHKSSKASIADSAYDDSVSERLSKQSLDVLSLSGGGIVERSLQKHQVANSIFLHCSSFIWPLKIQAHIQRHNLETCSTAENNCEDGDHRLSLSNLKIHPTEGEEQIRLPHFPVRYPVVPHGARHLGRACKEEDAYLL